jgi:hypothetical protein
MKGTQMTDRNALGDAYAIVAEAAGLLDLWSKRPAPSPPTSLVSLSTS